MYRLDLYLGPTIPPAWPCRLLPSDDDDGDGDDDRKEMMAQWQPPAPLLQYIWILCLFFCPNQLPDEDKGISFVFSFRFSPFLFFVFFILVRALQVCKRFPGLFPLAPPPIHAIGNPYIMFPGLLRKSPLFSLKIRTCASSVSQHWVSNHAR